MSELQRIVILTGLLGLLALDQACAVGEIGGVAGNELDPSSGIRETSEAPSTERIQECPRTSPDFATRDGWRSVEANQPAQDELRIELKARPTAPQLDGLLAVGAEDIDHFDDAAITVRFAEDGLVDVRDGAFYVSDLEYPYEPGVWYSIAITADIDSQTYDVEIGPCGGPRAKLIDDASFRDSAAAWDELSTWGAWSETASLELSTASWMLSGSCVPTTCAALGHACGQPSDGCGGQLDCGGCGNSEFCDTGLCVAELVSSPSPPSCVPDTCEVLAIECGVRSDGCGDYIACGECPSGSSCSAGVCVADPTPPPPDCVPDSCATLARECGVASDGCGGALSCGSCASGESCASGGVCVTDPTTPPVCVPHTCQSLGVECSFASDGCGGLLSCGACDSNASCQSGACVDEPVPPLPPDGDPNRPWAHNTGPSNLGAMVPSGSLSITTDGAVYENLDINGDIYIDASNVTIRNFRINGGFSVFYGINIASGNRNILIEDGEIFNVGNGIRGLGYTARRIHIHDNNDDGLRPEGAPGSGPTLVEHCFIERMGLSQGAHADALQVSGVSEGSYDVTLQYNNFYMPAPGTPEHPGDSSKASAVIFLAKPVSNYLIQNNWMNGGGYTIYCGGNTDDVLWRNNIFGDDYDFGPITGTCQNFVGNVWEATGQLVPN